MNIDYINVTTSTGETKQMELVAMFKLKSNDNCIIYKDDKENYFVGKLDSDGNLSTDFSNEEKKYIYEVYEQVTGVDLNA